MTSVVDNLPGVSVQEGNAYGFDNWSSNVAMRGFQGDDQRGADRHHHRRVPERHVRLLERLEGEPVNLFVML